MHPCINLLFISSDNKKQLEKTVRQLEKKFQCYYINEESIMSNALVDGYELEFISEDTFPEVEMYCITKSITDISLQIISISYEISSEYLGYHIFKEGVWKKMYEHHNKPIRI